MKTKTKTKTERIDAHAAHAARTGEFHDDLVAEFYRWAAINYRAGVIERDDAVQEAVMECLRRAHLYSPDRGTASTFFVTVIRHHYSSLRKREHRQCRRPRTGKILSFYGDGNGRPLDVYEDLRVPPSRSPRGGGRHPKVTLEVRARIFRMHEAGEMGTVIAKKVGICPTYVSRILKGERRAA